MPIKFQQTFFLEMEKLILKLMWKCKGPRVAKIIFKKTKLENYTA